MVSFFLRFLLKNKNEVVYNKGPVFPTNSTGFSIRDIPGEIG